MEGFNKKFLADILKYYGFAFSIPLGKCLLSIVFDGKSAVDDILLSLAAFMIGIILFMIGGLVHKDD